MASLGRICPDKRGVIGMWEIPPMRSRKPHSDKRTYQDVADRPTTNQWREVDFTS